MWPRRIELRLGSCEVVGVAKLDEYALRFHKRGGDGSGKCDAFHTASSADCLYGVVYSLTQAQRDLLDDFEGPGYVSRDVSVRTRSGMLTAYVYVAKAEHVAAGLQPFSWYQSIVEAGARTHDLPAHYIESIATVRALPDPDSDRDSHHLAMLDRDIIGGACR
jgi:hypothetical protein